LEFDIWSFILGKSIKVLFIGDLIGRPGRSTVKKLLPGIRQDYAPDLVIANAENSAGGFGITRRVYHELIEELGIDVLTSGNHVWDKKEIMTLMAEAECEALIRPYNYPKAGVPGQGVKIVEVKGVKVAVTNLLGCVFIGSYDSPFHDADKILEELPKDVKTVIVDIHAEATSEKSALGWYLDGRVSAVIGTHTHVQTADERILPKGTAYLTDAGMTGGMDSVIGVDKDKIIERFLTQVPIKFEPAKGAARFDAVFIEIDAASGKALKCERIQRFTKVEGK
jgi:2',3'-cyclic-nucleotide 2'-phosphodiesterase